MDMMRTRGLLAAAALLPAIVRAQGVSTAGIRGHVGAPDRPSAEVRVQVRHEATGFAVEVRATGGRFLVQGLEPGGPYTVTARALGFAPRRATGLVLAIGERRDVDLVLQPVAAALDTVAVTARGLGLATRALSDVVIVNLNLPEPVATDRFGRVMYGAIGGTGLATLRPRSAFTEVIDLRDAPGSRAYELSSRLETTRTRRASGSASYTYSRARDIQTPLRVNARGSVLWASARATSGRHDDLTPGISSNDVPHRVIVTGSYAAPWRRARTELSLYYVGESGRPFTYLAYGALRRGDLNADGSNANDPIYVPRSAFDTAEIRFSGLSDSLGADNAPAVQAARVRAQQTAFEAVVEHSRCLRRSRGRILERNGCREPWSNTTIASVRQSVPVARGAVPARATPCRSSARCPRGRA